MHMIRHDAKHIQFDMGIMIWQIMPRMLHNLPALAQFHLNIHNNTE